MHLKVVEAGQQARVDLDEQLAAQDTAHLNGFS